MHARPLPDLDRHGQPGLILLLLYPFEDSIATVWLPLTALPYFWLYSRDLAAFGYRAQDVVRVYALNVMLVGVNLGGVAKSLQQACTRRPTPFKRTPKTVGRTAAPALYVAIPYAMLGYLLFGAAWDVVAQRWVHSAVTGLNALLLIYAVRSFIGWRESCEDALASVYRRIAVRLGRRRASA